MRNGLRWLAVTTAVGMLLVLLMGALVTKTASGRGCGDDWPLCHGKFVPAYTIESLIEYSHRFVSGIEGLLVVALTYWVWKAARKRWDLKLYAGGAFFFTFLQAGLGAAAVKWPQSAGVLALHFGFSLMAAACTILLAIALWKWNDGSQRTEDVVRSNIDKRFRHSVWFATLFSYLVVYLGAYVRHTKSMAGCGGWPLCNGELIPPLTGASGIAFIHRLAAVVLLVLVVMLLWRAKKDYRQVKTIYIGSRLAMLFIMLQIVSGGWVIYTLGSDWQLLSSLFHTIIVSSLFSVLCYMSVLVYQLRSKSADAADPQASGREEWA